MLRRAPLASVVLFAFVQPAPAEDLLAIYQRALAADPQIREADATRLAAREAKPQAIATLLPQVSGSAGYDKNKFEGTSDQAQIVSDGPNAGEITIFGTSGTREPETKSWSLDLRQSLFRWVNWMAPDFTASRALAAASFTSMNHCSLTSGSSTAPLRSLRLILLT